MTPSNRNDPTTTEETQKAPAVQREEGAVKQGEEDDTLDWAAVVTTNPEYLAVDMDQSTDNVSEM